MNLLITHHHLGPGGVTKVIANHVLALDAASDGPMRVGLIYDGNDTGWPTLPPLQNVEVIRLPVPTVGYSDAVDGRPVADAMLAAIAAASFNDAPMHVHNHSLGKSVAFSCAVRELAERAWPLLLHCHDFAEDYRPAGYRRLADALGGRLSATLYSHAPQVHFAALNGRDVAALANAGIPRDRLHFLPNPVPAMPQLPGRRASRQKLRERLGVPEGAGYWLYPVRGIRRKNVGEVCLLAAAARGRVVPAVTLAPANPKERPFYEFWRSLALELDLPVQFGAGESGGLTFMENLAAADRVLTASVAEGFGMVFLESWLAGKSLVGRDLPEITADFKAAGLDLSGLTPRIDVPYQLVAEGYPGRLHDAATQISQDYGREPPSRSAIDASVAGRVMTGRIDFGDLDEELQSRVIREVATDTALADDTFSQWHRGEVDVSDNAAVVRDEYDLITTGRRLISLYRLLADTSADDVTAADGEQLLDEFQSIDRLRLIRT